jgi:hypothetical protein
VTSTQTGGHVDEPRQRTVDALVHDLAPVSRRGRLEHDDDRGSGVHDRVGDELVDHQDRVVDRLVGQRRAVQGLAHPAARVRGRVRTRQHP